MAWFLEAIESWRDREIPAWEFEDIVEQYEKFIKEKVDSSFILKDLYLRMCDFTDGDAKRTVVILGQSRVYDIEPLTAKPYQPRNSRFLISGPE